MSSNDIGKFFFSLHFCAVFRTPHRPHRDPRKHSTCLSILDRLLVADNATIHYLIPNHNVRPYVAALSVALSIPLRSSLHAFVRNLSFQWIQKGPHGHIPPPSGAVIGNYKLSLISYWHINQNYSFIYAPHKILNFTFHAPQPDFPGYAHV